MAREIDLSGGSIVDSDGVATEIATPTQAAAIAEALVGALPTLEDGSRTTVDDSVTGQVKVDLPSTVAELRVGTLPFTQVTNTTVETTITTLSIAADELAAGSVLNWQLAADLSNNTGAPATTTIRIKCNGSTVWTITLAAVAASASARKLYADLPAVLSTFIGVNAFGRGMWALSDAGADTVATQALIAAAVAAVPATAHNWTVTCQHSVASSNLTFQAYTIQAGYRP